MEQEIKKKFARKSKTNKCKLRIKTQVNMIQEKLTRKTCKNCRRSCSNRSWSCNRSRNERKKLRIEDALSATKAAVEEGIVAGGGTAYINISKK